MLFLISTDLQGDRLSNYKPISKNHKKIFAMSEKNEEVLSFECNVFPKNASEENKTGIVIKGKDSLYINATKMLSELFSTKGEQFHINGVDSDNVY